MNINNKRGVFGLTALVATHGFAASFILGYKIAAGAILLAAVWHIPAWDTAKASHTEAAYQAQEMFPQQLADKLPGGIPGRKNTVVAMGNGGNFIGGNSRT